MTLRTRTNPFQGAYTPPWWYNRHIASGVHMGKAPDLPYRREVLHHSDGSQISCDFYPPKPVGRSGVHTNRLYHKDGCCVLARLSVALAPLISTTFC
jgi:hypothetical protein